MRLTLSLYLSLSLSLSETQKISEVVIDQYIINVYFKYKPVLSLPFISCVPKHNESCAVNTSIARSMVSLCKKPSFPRQMKLTAERT